MSDGICASVLAHSSLLVDISLSLSYVIKKKNVENNVKNKLKNFR